MEGARLSLARTLLRKPRKYKQHHFSNPGPSSVIAVENIDLGTTTREKEIHTIARGGKTTPRKAKKTLSQEPSAIRKRNWRKKAGVREKERKRENLANAKKRSEPAHATRLAKRRAARKEGIELVKVTMKRTSTTPFASPDESEGTYTVATRTIWTKEVYKTHKFTARKKGASPRAIGANSALVRVEYDNKNRASAQALCIL